MMNGCFCSCGYVLVCSLFYVTRATVDSQDGSILSPSLQECPDAWPIDTDDDVMTTFQKANDYFTQHEGLLKRPSILLHISRDPKAPPPPPPPAYLENMADPSQSESMTMLSFYAFPPSGIDDPDEFAALLRKLWTPFDALGRVYVAHEGVNAQMSIPTNV